MNRLLRVLLGCALLAAPGCQAGEKRPQERPGRTIVALYTDIDGVSFSTDGAPYSRYTDFLEREETVQLTAVQLANLLDALEREGFFREQGRRPSTKGRPVPEAIFRICVASPTNSRECVFLFEKGANVPARYREIFATLPIARRPAALDRFLKMNGQLDP